MRILLPPSEGKTAPVAGPALDLDQLALQELNPVRREVSAALIDLCRRSPKEAAMALGLGKTQSADVSADAALAEGPCGPAIEVYTGVLFDALGWDSLAAAARDWVDGSVLISSALFGLLRPTDPIPYYRLSGGVRLPGLPTMRGLWSGPITQALATEPGLVVDMRSGTYAALGACPADRSVTVRVMTVRDGRKVPVSHHNKATKGRLVRAMAESGASAGSTLELLHLWRDLGWEAAESGPGKVEVMAVSDSA